MPNVVTCGSLISTCEKGKREEHSSALLEAMQWQGVVPNVIAYSCLISTCENRKQPEQTPELLEAMQRQGVVPDAITCNSLMSTCALGQAARTAPGAVAGSTDARRGA